MSEIEYLGVKITSYGDTYEECEDLITKTNRVAGCLNNLIWYNKNIRIETKSRIYKTVVRPMLTYSSETAAITSKIKNKMASCEMKILRKIAGHTLRDRIRNTNIRNKCKVTPVDEWVKDKKSEWNDHISRMDDVRHDCLPRGRRPLGRPRKRWRDK